MKPFTVLAMLLGICSGPFLVSWQHGIVVVMIVSVLCQLLEERFNPSEKSEPRVKRRSRYFEADL